VFVSGEGPDTWLFYFDWLDTYVGLRLCIGETLYEISNAMLVCGSSGSHTVKNTYRYRQNLVQGRRHFYVGIAEW
jgi:hypothetical protein